MLQILFLPYWANIRFSFVFQLKKKHRKMYMVLEIGGENMQKRVQSWWKLHKKIQGVWVQGRWFYANMYKNTKFRIFQIWRSSSVDLKKLCLTHVLLFIKFLFFTGHFVWNGWLWDNRIWLGNITVYLARKVPVLRIKVHILRIEIE
jgi:hypothetical protein